jgi:hypothetical protein
VADLIASGVKSVHANSTERSKRRGQHVRACTPWKFGAPACGRKLDTPVVQRAHAHTHTHTHTHKHQIVQRKHRPWIAELLLYVQCLADGTETGYGLDSRRAGVTSPGSGEISLKSI